MVQALVLMFYTQAVNFGFLLLDASLPCILLWRKQKADLHAALTFDNAWFGRPKIWQHFFASLAILRDSRILRAQAIDMNLR